MTQPVSPTPSWKEEDRLKALASYEILDTPQESDFDDIARMAAEICQTPISIVNFISADRQWFKSEIGLGVKETKLDVAICSHAILQHEIFIVPDTTQDPRFSGNPLVTGDPHLRFYAGALLETPDGLPIGTMCVLDYKPRTLTDHQQFVLQALARQVMTQLELRRALREKRQSEERVTLALAASGFVGTWDWDISSNLVFADPSFIALFGGDISWSRDGAPIENYLRAIHPHDLPGVRAAIDAAVKTREPFRMEYRLVQADASARWIDARGRCHYDKQGNPTRFPGVAVDITARKESEQQALDSADRFRFLAESMPQKIFTARANGDVDFFNSQWMEFTGLSFEEIRDWGWKQFVHPDDLEENLRRWNESLALHKDYEMEHRFRRHDGVYRWHLSRALPMRNDDGEVVMWIGSNTDIDDQRRAAENLERMVEERTTKLRESVAELEAFSYSISHDMRAPLRAMSGFAEIIKQEYGAQLDETARRYLDRIGTATTRMDDLIRDVLSFSQISRAEMELRPVSLDRLVREIVESYPNLHANGAEIVIRGELPVLLAHNSVLTQCVSNLLGNAVKFVTPGTAPRVEVWSEERDERVRTFFRDNGIGIPVDQHQKIFEIFHRGDRTFEGTGIGLAIVKKAVERMNGQVGLDSTPGQGSTFWIDLDPAPDKALPVAD